MSAAALSTVLVWAGWGLFAAGAGLLAAWACPAVPAWACQPLPGEAPDDPEAIAGIGSGAEPEPGPR